MPQQARWDEIKAVSILNIGAELPWGGKFSGVAKLIDDAFDAIEKDNEKLKGVLQRISGYAVNEDTLRGLIILFSDTHFTRPTYNGEPVHLGAKDILGHVYEYFLGRFAQAEGKRGGQYFTPKSIVSLIVEMLEPYSGRVYDPAMGSGGFFVQTERFITAHQGNINNVSIYGQEFNPTTWKLAAMNMAIRGIDYDFGKHNADSFTQPQHIDKKMDFIMANPPFNISDWWSESLADDPRWAYGTPPKGNANFAWLQHMIYHLSPNGKMALLLANGSMSSQTNNEGEIRKAIINADLVECIVALPGQLFTNTQIPACIWFLNRNKKRKGEVLFIDARQIGYMKDRVLRDFTAGDIANIADTLHAWQQSDGYEDQAAFCKSATLEDIAGYDFVLTPGRYVGTAEQEDDGVPFAEKMQNLTALLKEQFAKSAELEAEIKKNLGELGYDNFTPSVKKQTSICQSFILNEQLLLSTKINQTLNQIFKAIFKSWFIDFDPVIAKATALANGKTQAESELEAMSVISGKPVKELLQMPNEKLAELTKITAEFPNKFDVFENIDVPSGWKILVFDEFIEEKKEKVKNLKNIPEYSVTNNGIVPRSQKFNKQLSKNPGNNKLLHKTDLVFGMSREILNWGIMEDDIGSVSSAYHVYSINNKIVNSSYLKMVMEYKFEYFNDLIKPSSREGQSFDKELLKEKKIILPPKLILNKFLGIKDPEEQ
ncbi:putative type I restriction enzymeP M protein [Haemophilus haemolyticus]|nr:putative type I restriction enzymeP M protein [Haemophilus haemolyticus]